MSAWAVIMIHIRSGRIESSAARKSTPDSRPSRISIITTEGQCALNACLACRGSAAVSVSYPRGWSKSASEALKSTSSSTMRTRRSNCCCSLCGFDTAQLQRTLDRSDEHCGIKWLDQYSFGRQPFRNFVLVGAYQDGRNRAAFLAHSQIGLYAR